MSNPLLQALEAERRQSNPLLDALESERKPKPSTGRPQQSQRAAPSPQASRWQQELAGVDAEIAALQKKIDSGAFGGGRGGGGAGQALDMLRQKRADVVRKIESGREVRTTARDVGREIVNAPTRGVVGTGLGGVAGILDYAGADDAADRVRATRDNIQDRYRAPESAEQNFMLRSGGQLGEGLGSTVPFLFGGLPSVTAKVAVGALAGGTGVDEQDARVKAAREQGIDVSSAQEEFSKTLGGVVGLGEILPIGALLKRTPTGLGSKVVDAASERFGGTVGGRIAGAALEEGTQEAVAGVLQDTIERGVYNEDATIGENFVVDFVLGAAVGGIIRGGVETVDRTGRLVRRRREDTRVPPPGRAEQAVAAAGTPTQADIDSPLDTDTIVAGRTGTAQAKANAVTERELASMGLPTVGTRVVVQDPVTGSQTGTMRDRFTGEDGSGVVIELDNGVTMREYDDTLADTGVTIVPEGDAAPASPLDAPLNLDTDLNLDADPAIRAAQPVPTPPASATANLPSASAQQGVPSPVQSAEPSPAPAGGGTLPARTPVPDGGAVARSIFGDKARITSTYRGPNHPLSKKNPNSWHTKSRAAVDIAPIPGMTFAQAKAQIEAQGYTLIEAINEVGKGRTKHATGDHWHFVIGTGGGAPVAGAGGNVGANVAMPETTPAPAVDYGDPFKSDPSFLGERPAPASLEPETPPPSFQRDPAQPVDPANRDSAVTVTGREVPVEYRVVELGDLTASNLPDGSVNPRFPTDRQPRDRSRAASLSQVESIAGNLNPKLLGRSPKAADGAPIVSQGGVVESGNGRTMALQKVYEGNPDKAAEYRQFLQDEGFDTAGIDRPVLVRVRDEMPAEDVQAFVREANARDTAGMSGTETASSDASALPGQLLGLYRGGDVDAAGNRDFVRGFVNALVPANERASLVLADGTIAAPLMRRIEAALLVRAIGNRPFVEKLVDAPNNSIKAIGKALVEVAPALAQLREAVEAGTVDPAMDISENIAEAVEIVDRARREGKNVSDLVNQRDVFSGETVAPLTEAVLHLFFNGPRFTKPAAQPRIAERLGYYVEQAEQAAPGGGLFGESTKAQPGGILTLANERDQTAAGDQADLLDAGAARERERDGGDGAGVRQDSGNLVEPDR